MLTLRDYAEAVSLAIPYRRPFPLPARNRLAAVEGLVAYLLDESVAPQRPRKVDVALGDRRALLQTLLTVRPPAPLPEDFHSDLDAVLEGELQDRGIVDARDLVGIHREADAELVLWRGDITTLRADAIVNAANSALLGCFRPQHACIDNAIHSGAGPRLRDDCAAIVTLQAHDEPTGAAKITRGYNLPARYVLHTVGPIAQGVHNPTNANALAQCYTACLECVRDLGTVKTLAFCGISTGVFGYPKEPACRIAVDTVRRWLRANPGVCDLVVFNVFSVEDHALYGRALKAAIVG